MIFTKQSHRASYLDLSELMNCDKYLKKLDSNNNVLSFTIMLNCEIDCVFL